MVELFKISNLVQAVNKRNFRTIAKYKAERRPNEHVKDIHNEEMSISDKIATHLVLSTNGVTFKSSSKKVSGRSGFP